MLALFLLLDKEVNRVKEKILITSLARASENTPWRVGIFTGENYTFFTIGEKGQVAISPRFHMFINEIEKKVTRFPVDVSFHQQEKNREMEITKIKDQIVYADCDYSLNRLIPNARFYYSKEVFGTPLALPIQRPMSTEENTSALFSVMEVSQNLASTTMDYVAIGRVTHVTDGDTIDVTIASTSDFLDSHGIPEGANLQIRFNGVDTPEKKQEGAEDYKDPKNTSFAKQYGLKMEDMYDIGAEAKDYTAKLIGWSEKSDLQPLVILNFDREKDGSDPMMDAGYGRYVADVYATKETVPSILMEKITKGNSFVHVNKSLLVEKSKKYPDVPLGLFQFQYAYNKSSMLNPFSWVSELGLTAIDSGSPQTPGMKDPSQPVDPTSPSTVTEIPETELDTDTLNFSTSDGPKKNSLDFFEPYDDRLTQFTKGINKVEDLKYHSKVRIGDVILTIPPTSIEIDKTSTISKIKTMRTKSSILVNRGQTLSTLRMDLYFHDLEAINGTQYPWKPMDQYNVGDEVKYFYVDGLRPLLAQFAKVPFVPIDNYYINETLGIRDVALMDIEVTTVPNFPESLTASITLVEFNSEAYLMDHGTLGEAINYPMMRWFYNQSMDSSRGEKYRNFEGLNGPLDTKISFTLADENYLKQRKDAVMYMRSADSPEKVRTELKTKNTTYQTKKEDADKVKGILNQYDMYKDADVKEYSIIDTGETKNIIDYLVDKYKIKKETAENAYTAGEELYKKMYDGHMQSTNDGNYFMPYETRPYNDMRFDFGLFDIFVPSAYLPVDYEDEKYKGKEKSGLIVVSPMKDNDNQAKLEKSFKDYYNKDKKAFYLPATKDAISVLNDIAKGAKDMEKSVDKYEDEFNRMIGIIDASENGVPMNSYEINGDCIPISMNARFSNQFAMLPVQAGEQPALQFMGGGDPGIDFVLEVDEEAAKSFSELIAISDRYAKEYSQGITNGFIGIENNLAQLFGIRYIMFESISISTIPNFPGRFQLMVKAISFDKTQRHREELTSIPGNSQHMDLEMLKENKMAFANDRMLEARLHTLEVYPDLELPTYDELNAALKEMDAGNCEEYINNGGGIFLDPDFYFSQKTTFRKLVDDMYGGNHQLNMFDATGVAAYTSSTDAEKLFNTTDEDWDQLKDLEKTDGVKPIGWIFKWSGSDENSKAEPNTDAGTKASDSVGELTVDNKDVQKFLNDRDEKGQPTYNKFPTKEEWDKLFPGGEYDHESFSKNPSGSEQAIYKELSKQVDKYFGKYYSAKEFIKECRGDLKNADKSKKNASYAPPDEYYKSAFLYKMNTLGWEFKKLRTVNALIKKGTIKQPEKESEFVSMKDIKSLDGKPTKERVMTMMKAFLDKMSGWEQYKEKTPAVSKQGRVGIAQVSITGKDMKVDEVKRLMYNWKYNIEVAVKQLAGYYGTLAKGLQDDGKNFEVWTRPLDAMFALYEDPSKKVVTLKNITDSDYASGIMNRFNYYAEKPFNTLNGFNQETYKDYAGLSKEEKVAVGDGDKDQYITSLLDLEYYDLDVLKDNSLKVDSNKEQIKKVMKKHLDKLPTETLKGLYEQHLKMLYELNNSDSKTEKVVDFMGKYNLANLATAGLAGKATDKATDMLAGSKPDKNGYEYSREIFEKGAKLYEQIRNMDKTAEQSTASYDTRLYNDVDPHLLYQEMFYDMRYYDQRGRMLRAFPGFQMFIIDEGDYFGKYKFWDNMYGYNAIESIDVYRSRKIAADTALISMSNVYSNLSTRRTDIDFVDRNLKFWDNYVWNQIPQDLIDKKENEVHKNLYLEPGSRIHLRMGYASNASDLPVVFNGTITEIELGDMVQIVAQGDGIELGNVISGDPDDDNDGIFNVTEPRDLICSLMSSKGSWLKDYFNRVSDGQLFQKNPLGIMHFGQPFNTEDSTASKPLGNILWFNDEYGEVAQNIYSSNGTPTFSQWLHPNGERNNIFEDFSWKRLWENKFKILNPGDEKNVVVKFYNNTVWDVIQTIAYTSPDYIAAVMPFEQRSTLFFGKPYWRAAYNYDSRYEFDAANKTWARHLQKEARRPYMQHKFYTSHFDIIENNVKASEDGVFTNVIVNYDGKQTPVLYADADIRYDKQKTRVVDADIVAKFADYYTSEVMASYFGHSALRDSLKDMYKGNLLVIGDPTAKPHDMMYIGDDIIDLRGNALIKSVTHHFSMETGFVTSLEPDLIVVNDDTIMLEISKWFYSFATSLGTTLVMSYFAKKATRNLVGWLMKPGSVPHSVGKWVSTKGLRSLLNVASDGSKDMVSVIKTLDQIIAAGDKDVTALQTKLTQQLADAYKNLGKSTGKAAIIKDTSRKALLQSAGLFSKMLASGADATKITKTLFTITRGVASFNPVGLIVNTGLWIGSEMIFEHYRRFKENLQCVVAIPLTYKGKELVAGINNHAGMVLGDNPGRYDKLYDAQLGKDDGDEVEGIFGNSLVELANFFTGSGGQYANQEKTEALNNLVKSPK